MSYPGLVKTRTTEAERDEEIRMWFDDPWYWTIRRLNDALAGIDPDYDLQQVKQKFGEFRFYYNNSREATAVVRTLSAMLVREAEREIAAIERRREEKEYGD